MASNTKVKDAAFPMFTPPGVSLTAPEKSRPWQQPPKLVKLDDVIRFYIGAISDKDSVDGVLDSLETGISISSIAESLMLGSVSQGIHTIDAGILVMPIIIEMLVTAAEINNIDYVIYETDVSDGKIPARAAREAARIAVESLKGGAKAEEPMIEEEEAPAGLMAKQKVEV